jgi:hypothetical protein
MFLYLKIKLFETEKASKIWLEYNEDKICRECYGKNDLSANRGKKNLEDKNILIFNENERKVKINCDPLTWRVKPEQHEKIVKIMNDENLVFHRDSK